MSRSIQSLAAIFLAAAPAAAPADAGGVAAGADTGGVAAGADADDGRATLASVERAGHWMVIAADDREPQESREWRIYVRARDHRGTPVAPARLALELVPADERRRVVRPIPLQVDPTGTPGEGVAVHTFRASGPYELRLSLTRAGDPPPSVTVRVLVGRRGIFGFDRGSSILVVAAMVLIFGALALFGWFGKRALARPQP